MRKSPVQKRTNDRCPLFDSRLVVDALEMAVARKCPGDNLVARSDRGVPYASEHYQRLLRDHVFDEPQRQLLGSNRGR